MDVATVMSPTGLWSPILNQDERFHRHDEAGCDDRRALLR